MSDTAEGPKSKLSTREVPGNVIIEYDVEIPMRDGVVLRGDVARPAEGKSPVIVIQSPYGKSEAVTVPVRNIAELARQGFAAAYIDTRGRFSSDGAEEFIPFARHENDGCDVVEWAARQPWSNGDVFGFGPSYHGFTQWMTARERPSALKAFSPGSTPGAPTRSMFFWDGLFELGLVSGWWMMMGADVLARRHADDPTALEEAMGRYSPAFLEMIAANYSQLPLSVPFEKANWGDRLIELVRNERGHGTPTLDALRTSQQFEDVTVPAFIWGGWYDLFSMGSIDQYVGMRTRAGSEAAREQSRLVMGPWVHTIDQSNVVGERDFGPVAAAMAFPPNGLNNEILDFFRQTSAGAKPGKNRVKLFIMGANVWRDEEDWPIARTKVVPMYLGNEGSANGVSGNGWLSADFRSSPPDSYVYDPADPVPTFGGITMGLGLPGPRDQRTVEQRSDVLVYTSEPLTAAMEVTGTAYVELWVETDVVDTDFVAKLVDVAPDGTAYQVAEGGRRARWRDDPEMKTEGSPLPLGEPTLIRIDLSPTSNMFLPGHAIRIDITSSNFPRWRRNLNIWEQVDATLDDSKVANHQVLHDAQHRSCVFLPVIPT